MIRSLNVLNGFKPVLRSLRYISVDNDLTRHKPPENNQKNSADTFGVLNKKEFQLDGVKDDPDDRAERRRLEKMDRKQSSYYINAIKSHLSNHQYDKAVELLSERMLKVDKVKPDSYIYDLLISYCGRKGDVQEAYKLYNQIKKRRYFVTGGQYTSLFNACANSKISHIALEVARKVREDLSKNEIHKANINNYNSMLKAFGRHGDLKTCLKIMDEVLERRGRVLQDTYNFLLQSCISDPNSGFRHALMIWHRMLVNKTDPSIYSFNLMLRAARDCSLGIPEGIEEFLKQILSEGTRRSTRKIKISPAPTIQIPLSAPTSIGEVESQAIDSLVEREESSNLQTKDIDGIEKSDSQSVCLGTNSLSTELTSDLPNLLSIKPKIGEVLELATFTTAYHRLMLLGGVTGFLQVMDSLKIIPDMKTFTLLLEIIPSEAKIEEELMNIAKLKKIRLDAGFFNVLIKRRSYRYDYAGATDVLRLMQEYEALPDLHTFGVLALTCRNMDDAVQLLNNIRDAGFRANSQILTPFVRRAGHLNDLRFIKWILRVIKEDEIQPDAKLMVALNNAMKHEFKKVATDKQIVQNSNQS